jgi:predicted ester cyclase
MHPVKNKEIIQLLYDSILNQKNVEKLAEVVSPDYTNNLGGKGVEGFQKTISELLKAFPDGQWKAEELLADGNKVIVRQTFTGTQTHAFQQIKPTNKTVLVNGVATYELQQGKIIRSLVQTDRLTFLQQLGVLPVDLSTVTVKKELPDAAYFIDKFSIPKANIEAFKKQMNEVRGGLRTLPGYVKGEAFEQYDNEGNLTIVTLAIWENQQKQDEAKAAVQAEFKRRGFNAAEFYQQLNIKLERGQYSLLKD